MNMIDAPTKASLIARRARQLEPLLEELKRSWVKQLGGVFEKHLLLDTKLLPVGLLL